MAWADALHYPWPCGRDFTTGPVRKSCGALPATFDIRSFPPSKAKTQIMCVSRTFFLCQQTHSRLACVQRVFSREGISAPSERGHGVRRLLHCRLCSHRCCFFLVRPRRLWVRVVPGALFFWLRRFFLRYIMLRLVRRWKVCSWP